MLAGVWVKGAETCPSLRKLGHNDLDPVQLKAFLIASVLSSRLDGRSGRDQVSTLIGFILNCDVSGFESISEGRKGRQRTAREAACGTIEFYRPMQSGCVNG